MSRRLVVDLNARAPAWAIPPAGMAELRSAAPPGWEAVIIDAPTTSDGDGGAPPSDEARSAIGEAEVYAGFGMSRALFTEGRRLRWVHSAAAGVGGLLFPEMRASDVIITNSAGVHATPIAEHVLAGVLFLLRALDVARERQRAHAWDRPAFVGRSTLVREVADCRVLVIGAGGIGSAIAQRFTALGARCRGVRRHPERGVPNGFAAVLGPRDWAGALGDTDILVVSAPATDETHDLVTGALLDRLPRQAIVANVARGSLVDEAALAERIAAGRIRGAVLDVFAHEPLEATSPLWGLSSVVMTPHVSAVSPHGYWRRELDLLIDNWRRFASGQPMRNVVDRTLGY
ncbi:MAG: D-2-hydroxyacid dehydrogenase [Gemmatimonadaceae bacterium]